jgi:hypothetical protein
MSEAPKPLVSSGLSFVRVSSVMCPEISLRSSRRRTGPCFVAATPLTIRGRAVFCRSGRMTSPGESSGLAPGIVRYSEP